MFRYRRAGVDGVESEAVDEQHCDVVQAAGTSVAGGGRLFKESVYSPTTVTIWRQETRGW